MRSIHRRPPAVPILLFFVALALCATVTYAVGTTLYRFDTAEQLEDGELEHVVLSSLGEVKLGRRSSRIELDDISLVWSVLEASDGATWLGTGNTGKLLRLRGSKVSTAAELEGLVVSALAEGEKGTIYAGTLPEGKIYAIGGGSKVEASLLTTLEKGQHVWALAWDAQRRVLFAGTGPEGIVYGIDPTGRAEVYYDSADDHALSLLLEEPGGDLLVGTSPKARLLRVTGPGRASALHDFDATEVKGIARHGDGSKGLYVAVNTFPAPPALPKTTRSKAKTTSRARPKPGKGKIFRRLPNGNLEPLLAFDDGHLTGIEALDDGLVYAGTGAKGRIVAVGDDRVSYTIADVDERQVLALSLGGDPLFVTGDAGAIYRLGKAAAGLAEYRTPSIDSGFVSRWGRLSWRGEGALVVQTRSGNTEEPDQTWTDWSKALTRSGAAVESPAARYLQVRVRWNRDPNAVLRGLEVYLLPNNQRAVVTKLDVTVPFDVVRPAVGKKAVSARAPAPPKTSKSRSSKRRREIVPISWKIDNPDRDRLRYRLFFREESDTRWLSILPSDKVLTTTSHSWNTTAVPAGTYLVKVEASDELDNPSATSIRSEKLSVPVTIDNEEPRLEALTAKARRVEGRAIDGFSPLARLEWSLDGREWSPIAPTDGILDSADERFAFELPAALGAGTYTVAVRALDRARNETTGRVLVTVR